MSLSTCSIVSFTRDAYKDSNVLLIMEMTALGLIVLPSRSLSRSLDTTSAGSTLRRRDDIAMGFLTIWSVSRFSDSSSQTLVD